MSNRTSTPAADADASSLTYDLAGLRVRIGAPVLVGRSRGYLWFPTLSRFSSGLILATLNNHADVTVNRATAHYAWSADDGRTWSPLSEELPYGDVCVHLGPDEALLLPYYFYPRPGGAMSAPCIRVTPSTRRLEVLDPGVTVTGLPRPEQSQAPQLGVCGLLGNGQCIRLADGRYLANLYGHMEGDKRYNLLAIVSTNGREWTYLSTIDDAASKLHGNEGPCESALCRTKDGRIMAVYRVGSQAPYGQCWSSDEGRTWSTPQPMHNAFSVQPSLATLPDRTIALSGGRPSVYLWFDPAGMGERWRRVNLEEHHNVFVVQEPFEIPGQSTAYTEIIPIGPRSLLCVYDRMPFGWAPIPAGSALTNTVWAVRVDLL